MANLPKFTDKDFRNEQEIKGKKLTLIQRESTICQALRCRKEIIRFEEKRNTNSASIQRHPKDSKKEALDLLRCHSKNLTFEPVCLESFNDARECLFKLDGQMRVCEPELNLFEECRHDPVRFEKFQRLATPLQRTPKDYFATIHRKNYFI